MNKNQTNILGLLAAVGGAVLARSVYRRWKAYDFTDKSVLITGGSRGLGLVLARQLAEQGANISICARDEDELERARKDLQQHGANVFTFKCDVTNNTEVQEMVQAVMNRFGAVGRADTRRHPETRRRVDRDRVRRSVIVEVRLAHEIEPQRVDAIASEREADHAPRFLDHEVDHLRRHQLRRADQIPFVLAILVVGNDDELAVADVFDRLFYRSEDHVDSLSKR